MAVKTTTCVECGAVLKAGAAFCTACGRAATDDAAQSATTPPPEAALCAECGKVLRPNASFCTGCGRSVGVDTAAAVGAAAAGAGSAAADKRVNLAKDVKGAKAPQDVEAAKGAKAPQDVEAAKEPSDSADTKDTKSVAKPGGSMPPPPTAASIGLGVSTDDASSGEPNTQAAISCGTCGKPMRPGLTVCSSCGGKAAPVITEEARQSGPKGSRTILASVSGGASSYGSRAPAASSSPPPPTAPSTPAGPDPNHNKRVAVAVAAVLLLLLACAGVVYAALGSDGNGSVRAGSSIDSADGTTRVRRHTGTSGGSSDSAPSDSKPADSVAPGSTNADPEETTTTVGHSGSGGTTPGTHAPGTVPPATSGGTPPPPPPPVTNPALPPAVLQVGVNSASMSGNGPQTSVRISNRGGQPYSFVTGISGIPGGVSVSPASGSVAAGASLDLTLTWHVAGTPEGFYNGRLDVSTNVGLKSVSLQTDSRAADQIDQFGWQGPACAQDSYLTFRVLFLAQGGAAPALPPNSAALDRTITFVGSTLNGASGNLFSMPPEHSHVGPNYVNYRSRAPITVNGGRRVLVTLTDTAGTPAQAIGGQACS